MKNSSNGTSNGNAKLIALVLVLALVSGAAYFLLSGKSDEGTAPAPAATETAKVDATQPATSSTEPAPATTEPAPVVVETKTLNLPAAAAPSIPVAEKSKDPAVEAMMGVRKIGSDSAPVKVVEYSSLTCGHCSAFHKNDFPKLKAEFIDTGKVQFIFKEFPLNKPALDASKVLRCMPEDKFYSFQSLLFEQQDKWAYQPDYMPPLKQNAKLAGLSEQQIDACLNNKDLENRIIGDMKAGTDKYKIESTPTFIINDGARTIVGHQALSVFEESFKVILEGAAAATPVAPVAPETTPAAAPAATETPAPAAEAPAPAPEEKK